jgi:hypothetical protein
MLFFRHQDEGSAEMDWFQLVCWANAHVETTIIFLGHMMSHPFSKVSSIGDDSAKYLVDGFVSNQRCIPNIWP